MPVRRSGRSSPSTRVGVSPSASPAPALNANRRIHTHTHTRPNSRDTTASATSIDEPPPALSLKRGRKRKDQSLASDVAAALSEHYARDPKSAKLGRHASSGVVAASDDGRSADPDSTAAAASISISPAVVRKKKGGSGGSKRRGRLSAAALTAAASLVVCRAAEVLPPPTTPASKTLTQALPFIMHMLATHDLTSAACVSKGWHLVAQSPIVWSSTAILSIRPENLARAACNPILRNVKSIELRDSCTRDRHIKNHLLSFTQVSRLDISHFELDHLVSLTPEFGSLGRNLTTLKIRRDTSLYQAKRKREEVKEQWRREDEAAAASSAYLGLDSMEIVSPAATTRRLPSLYSFISLLSLLPNLTDLHWTPVDMSDFMTPNVTLRHLTTLRIERAAPPIEDAESSDESMMLIDSNMSLPSHSSSIHLPSPSLSSVNLPPLSPLVFPGGMPPKTPEQITWLRNLPCLTDLAWPGWNLFNIRSLCLPVLPALAQPTTPGMIMKSISGMITAAQGANNHQQPPSHQPPKRILPPQVHRLDLSLDLMSDSHLSSLSRLQSLTDLSLTLVDTEVTDAGLQHLCSLELLQSLKLKGVINTYRQAEEAIPTATNTPTTTHPQSQSSNPDANAGGAQANGVTGNDDRMDGVESSAASANNTVGVTRDVTMTGVPLSRGVSTTAAAADPMQVDSDSDSLDARPGGGLQRQQASIVSAKSTRDRRSAVRSVSMRQVAELMNISTGAGMDVGLDTGLASSGVALSSSSLPSRPRRSFHDLEVVRLASLCSLRSLELESLDLGREGLHILFHSLAQLTSLTLTRMKLSTLHPLGCMTRLKRLRFLECEDMKEPSLRRTLLEFKSLQELRIIECVGITAHAVEEMRREIDEHAAMTRKRTGGNMDIGDANVIPPASSSSSPSVRHWPKLTLVEFTPSSLPYLIGSPHLASDLCCGGAHAHASPTVRDSSDHAHASASGPPSPTRPCRPKIEPIHLH